MSPQTNLTFEYTGGFVIFAGIVVVVCAIVVAWRVGQIRDDVRYTNDLLRHFIKLVNDRLPNPADDQPEEVGKHQTT